MSIQMLGIHVYNGCQSWNQGKGNERIFILCFVSSVPSRYPDT